MVDHGIHCESSHQPVPAVNHRRRHQIVAVECIGGIGCVIFGVESHYLFRHHVGYSGIGVLGQQTLQRHYPAQGALAINDKQLVGLVRQFAETAQITQRDFKGDVGTDGDHVVIHQCADRVFRIG
ncbi:hypothetical protein GALL_517620 [mine drainage metagenome]|uniref:Uncharacterized protein n=1 Tax=mine drainage metagenome TaxID=410659 RepID=A0A1J5PN03_9ZZZZ